MTISMATSDPKCHYKKRGDADVESTAVSNLEQHISTHGLERGSSDRYATNSSESKDIPKLISSGLALAALAGVSFAGALPGGREIEMAAGIAPGALIAGGVGAQLLKDAPEGGCLLGLVLGLSLGGFGGAALGFHGGTVAAAALAIAGPVGACLLAKLNHEV